VQSVPSFTHNLTSKWSLLTANWDGNSFWLHRNIPEKKQFNKRNILHLADKSTEAFRGYNGHKCKSRNLNFSNLAKLDAVCHTVFCYYAHEPKVESLEGCPSVRS
jgi:hypothetical protein